MASTAKWAREGVLTIWLLAKYGDGHWQLYDSAFNGWADEVVNKG